MTALYVILGVIALIVLWVISIYNNLVKKRNLTEEAWSGIDVQLKRRANLIPNLIETVKGFMAHESGVLETVTELRSQSLQGGPPGERGKTEGMLGMALGSLFAVAENYPEIKADKGFIELHENLDEIEEQIQMARRYYNGSVRNLNTLIESFPSNLVAGQFKFIQAEFFEIEDATDRAVPEVKFD